MNMFRHIFTIAILAFGVGLWFLGPDDWKWADLGGPYVVNAISFCYQSKPFSVIICLVVATALFMTRKQY